MKVVILMILMISGDDDDDDLGVGVVAGGSMQVKPSLSNIRPI